MNEPSTAYRAGRTIGRVALLILAGAVAVEALRLAIGAGGRFWIGVAIGYVAALAQVRRHTGALAQEEAARRRTAVRRGRVR